MFRSERATTERLPVRQQQLQQLNPARDKHHRLAADQLQPRPQRHHQRGRQEPGHHYKRLATDGKCRTSRFRF